MFTDSRFQAFWFSVTLSAGCVALCHGQTFPIVDTGQQRCFDDRHEIDYPRLGEPYMGQDAQYQGHAPMYRDNGDGTVSDLVTDLMWQQQPGTKKTYDAAVAGVFDFRAGGYRDWRLPNIKELYSLIQFSGEDLDVNNPNPSTLRPFIDTKYFRFQYGDTRKGERIIDSQTASSTQYVGTTMGGQATMFGVNFADGRIKGYPISARPRGRSGAKTYQVFYVRGNASYGRNEFQDNRDKTITDTATGLSWMQVDSGHLKAGPRGDGTMNWAEALRWAEELKFGGHDDWRLPNAKELQSIVDYTRCPEVTNSPALDPLFQATAISDPAGQPNFGFYWTGTTHKRLGAGGAAVYIAFGRSQGWMSHGGGPRRLLDVHGAGSQRSDPKSGDPSQFPHGRGPQGDVIGIYNLVRAVRGGIAEPVESGPPILTRAKRPSRGGDQFGGPPARGFVRRLDRDGDGKISPQEFDGPAEAFAQLDRNRDGFLVETERPGGQSPPRQ